MTIMGDAFDRVLFYMGWAGMVMLEQDVMIPLVDLFNIDFFCYNNLISDRLR